MNPWTAFLLGMGVGAFVAFMSRWASDLINPPIGIARADNPDLEFRSICLDCQLLFNKKGEVKPPSHGYCPRCGERALEKAQRELTKIRADLRLGEGYIPIEREWVEGK